MGNFADMEDAREVHEDEAVDFARQNGFHHYIETSAKTGQNIVNVFTTITKHFYLLNEHNLEDFEDKDDDASVRGSIHLKLQAPEEQKTEEKKKKKCCGGGK